MQGFQSFMYTMLEGSSHFAARLSVTGHNGGNAQEGLLVRHILYNNFVIPIYVVTPCLYNVVV